MGCIEWKKKMKRALTYFASFFKYRSGWLAKAKRKWHDTRLKDWSLKAISPGTNEVILLLHVESEYAFDPNKAFWIARHYGMVGKSQFVFKYEKVGKALPTNVIPFKKPDVTWH